MLPLFCTSRLLFSPDWCFGTVHLMNSPHTTGVLKPVRRVRGIQAHRWVSNTSQPQTSRVNKSFKPGHILLSQSSASFSYRVDPLKVSRTNCGVIVFAWNTLHRRGAPSIKLLRNRGNRDAAGAVVALITLYRYECVLTACERMEKQWILLGQWQFYKRHAD